MNTSSEIVRNMDILLDFHQQIANTGFGDMLHDDERNTKFYEALELEINEMKLKNKPVHVLDIGTGTGLLALFAAKLGADSVTACERFRPMADCAQEIIKQNGYDHKINLVKKSSFELQIGIDMPQKANILVTELLDTELIGEGCLKIYNHAHAYLLTDDAVCIPSRARCHAALLESPLYAQWNRLKAIANDDGDIILRPPPQLSTCLGLPTMHDIHVSRVPPRLYTYLAQPLIITEFDFGSKEPLPLVRQIELTVRCKQIGRADIVCFWWDIDMDSKGTINLTCEPTWPLAPLPKSWREHWLQAFYYLPKPMNILAADTNIMLICCHDEYSWWFDVRPNDAMEINEVMRPVCLCSFHIMHSRSRTGQMNDAVRTKKYLAFAERFIENTPNAQVLTLGDSCLMGLLFCEFGVKKVYCHEPQMMSHDFMVMMKNTNNLKQVSVISDFRQVDNMHEITHVFAEPFFHNALLPWDNFCFIKMWATLRNQLTDKVKLAPYSARVFGMPMAFKDLHKMHSKVKSVKGFDMKHFDDMVEKSYFKISPIIENHALWEYEGNSLSDPCQMLDIVFDSDFHTQLVGEGFIHLKRDGYLNGIALWCDFVLDAEQNTVISWGPTRRGTDGDNIEWNMFTRQGVYFLPIPFQVGPFISRKIYYKVEYSPYNGKLNFDFKIVPNV